MIPLDSVLIFILSCFLGAVYVQAQGNYIRVCYYTNWAQYRPKAMKFFPEDVDPNLCTHLVYAFAKLNGNRLVAFEWNDESTEWMRGMYDRFNDIKAKNPAIKTLIAVGGWNMGSEPFTKMVATPTSRREFAESTVRFLRDRNFDGVDMDWEYPANRGSPPEDRYRFTQLLAEIRRAFDEDGRKPGNKEPLLLTSAVAAGKSKIDTGYDVPQFCRYMDFVSLMAYDLHGSWENITGHNSPLYPHSGETGDQRFLNMDWASNYWVKKGCPRRKLIIGMGLYGRSFTLSSYHKNGLMDPVKGKGDAGKFTREGGFLAYYEICEMQKQGATTYHIKEQQVPYVVLGSQWVGYDDVDSLRIKVQWMKQNRFGGFMVWALDLDDFKNSCGFGKYPLLTAMNQELNGGAIGRPRKPKIHRPKRPRVQPKQPHVQPQQPRVQPPRPHVQPQRPHVQPHQPHFQQILPQAVFTPPPPVTQPPTPPPTQPPANVMPHVSHDFQCPTQTGPNPQSYFANPTSCSEYYMCVGDVPIKFTCAKPLLWDERNNFCEWPNKIQCNKGTHARPPTAPQPPVPKPQAPIIIHTTPRPTTTTRRWVPPPKTTVRQFPPTTQYLPFNPAENNIVNNIPTWLEWSRWIAEFWNALATTPEFWLQDTNNNIQNNQASFVPNTPVANTFSQPGLAPPIVDIGPKPGASFCDGKSDGLHADPMNCLSYLHCVNGVEYRTTCPDGTAFDDKYGVCDFTANVKRCKQQGII